MVLRTEGLEVEAPLAFAALHRLLLPLTRLREHLPPPQARALAVAFGEDDGPSVEPFLVGVATLSLLTAAAEESLVLCVVDDAHWLDPASAGALLFCARRLGADRVVMVFAARDGAATVFEAPGLAEVTLAGLDVEAARALLATRLAGDPADDVARRLIAETSGNPLALLELPGELSAAQLEGAAPLPATLHLTARVERRSWTGVASCRVPCSACCSWPRRTTPAGSTCCAVRAADAGLDESVLQEAFDSGLLVGRGQRRSSLRHPLVRSAIYQAAGGRRSTWGAPGAGRGAGRDGARRSARSGTAPTPPRDRTRTWSMPSSPCR